MYMDLYPFFSQVANGSCDKVEQLIESNSFSANEQNSYGVTPLLHACTYDQRGVVDTLVKHGVNVNHQDKDGWGPLHKAAFLNHFELFTYLLSLNVDQNMLNNEGLLAYQVAREPEKYKSIMKNVTVDPKAQTKETASSPAVEPAPSPAVEPAPSPVTVPTACCAGTAPNMILFPGQGAQKVGMAKKYLENENVKKLFARASEILGWDLLDVCENGPKEKLDDTLVCQPAMYVTSLAALMTMDDATINSIGSVAGFSLGEYTALVFGGAISWECGLKLVQKRAQAMQDATKLEKTTMLSVVGLDDPVIDDICKQADVQVANYLFPSGRVLSGSVSGIQRAKQLAEDKKCMRAIELQVSGAFHSKYMEPAKQELDKALEETVCHEPRCKVYANIDCSEYTKDTVKEKLSQQLVGSVQWEQMFRKVTADKYYEVGPGNQLKSMMRRIDNAAWKNTSNV